MPKFWHRFAPATKQDIKIMADKITDLKAAFDALDAKLDKATAEIVAEIQTLKDALANTAIPDDAQASLDALVVKAQALDDLNPDAPESK